MKNLIIILLLGGFLFTQSCNITKDTYSYKINFPKEVDIAQQGNLIQVTSRDTIGQIIEITIRLENPKSPDDQDFPFWNEADNWLGVENRYSYLWCEYAKNGED